MRIFGFFIGILFLSACTPSEDKNVETDTQQKNEKKELIQVDGNRYIEYYDGPEQRIKFEGYQDDQQKRHGKWTHYSESGAELSMTMYEHGLRQGHSVVHYPNGAIYYYGEYDHDTMIGIWKTYDQQGKLMEEKDYGTPGK